MIELSLEVVHNLIIWSQNWRQQTDFKTDFVSIQEL